MSIILANEGAARALAKLFKSNNTTSVLVDDVFRANNRPMRNENDDKKNRQWLSNTLWTISQYGFIRKGFTTRDGSRVLYKLTLTEAGKQALGRRDEDLSSTTSKSEGLSGARTEMSTEELLESVNHDIESLRGKLPSFEVVFDIKPKGVIR